MEINLILAWIVLFIGIFAAIGGIGGAIVKATTTLFKYVGGIGGLILVIGFILVLIFSGFWP